MKYEELYERYYTMVYRLGLLLLKNPQDAEDAAQTIFLRLMEKQPELSDEEHTRAWLITVTRNYCRDLQRSFWHRRRADADMETLPEASVTPFDRQEGLLFEIFQSLPNKQREVVYLYYFEDYSVKEISRLLNRNESTVQSQLFAARKRMKKHFTATKAAALLLSLTVCLGFGTIAADAASNGKVVASIKEFFSVGISEKETKVAGETLSLPTEVYASELAAIDDRYLVLANERGLLIYDRENADIAAAFDLQEIECNYFNAHTLITRIFQDGEKLYLFNDHVESTDNERFYGKKNVTVSMPDFCYIFDLSSINNRYIQKSNSDLTNNDQGEQTFDHSADLVKITDQKEIEAIYGLWEKHRTDFKDTFEEFQGAEFLDENYHKFNETCYSEKSLLWTNESGKKVLSCITADKDSSYMLYTKHADGSFTCEPLNLILEENSPTEKDGLKERDGQPSDGAGQSSEADPTDENAEPDLLPEFVYSGDDAIMETICAYMNEIREYDKFCYDPENFVYIPSPLIFGTVEEGEDLLVFCNMWSKTYYRNGNMLVCDSGGEAPARLKFHPNQKKPGGYEVIEDIRTGDGAMYMEGIEDFCEGYPGMLEKYFSEKYNYEDVETEMVSMYVRDNHLSIKYRKDFGWDPVPLNPDEAD